MAAMKKGLGRGLAALIPDADMEFLSRVARGEEIVRATAPPEAIPGSAVNQSPQASASHMKRQNFAPRGASEAGTATGDVQEKTATLTIARATAPVERRAPETGHPDDGAEVEWVDVNLIEVNPYQPRRTFSQEELHELANSIRNHGILQPVLLRPRAAADAAALPDTGDGQAESQGTMLPFVQATQATQAIAGFQLVAGERRWRAAQEAGLARVPAIVRKVNDQQALELALVENVQRHDISALDAALAYLRLADEFKLSQNEIAQRVGKSRSAVANTLRLLDLPAEAQQALEDGALSEGHGRAILMAPSEGSRRAILRLILRDKLSVREAEEAARRAVNEVKEEAVDESKRMGVDKADTQEGAVRNQNMSKRHVGGAFEVEGDIRILEQRLQKLLGTKLRIRPRAKGGTVVIEYFSEPELERLIGVFEHGAELGAPG